MNILSPSILAADFSRLGEQIKEVEQAGAGYLHIDVMDGIFVPDISFGMPVISTIRPVTEKVFDVHLMIVEPERYIDEFADSVRKHWSIENQLHWCLDVIFREDSSRARKDNSPLNMNVLRKTALNLVSQAQYGRISKKKLMFKAALEPNLFLDILFFPKK